MRIVILSRQASLYSTTRLVQAGEESGHQVEVINPLTCPIELNCDLGDTPPPSSSSQIAIIPRIGASITTFGCALVRKYEQEGAWVLNPANGIAQSRDKLLSMQMMHGAGIPVPRTAVTGHPRGLNYAIRAVGGLPVVLKLRQGTQGRGVVLVQSMAAAQRAHAALNDFQQYSLVQEFIAEAHNKDIRIIVVGNQAIAAMERQARPGDFRANLHRGGRARAFTLDQKMASLAVQAAHIHSLGFAGVDMLITKRGPVVIEINSSPGLRGIEEATNVDVAGAVIRHIEKANMQSQTQHG